MGDDSKKCGKEAGAGTVFSHRMRRRAGVPLAHTAEWRNFMTIYIWGNASRYENYQRAVELAGDQVQFGGDPEGCAALLLPGGGDLEPWRYGQKNTASRGLEPLRDAA